MPSIFSYPKKYFLRFLGTNDEITIGPGAGTPITTETVTEVIIAIHDGSALTNTGRVVTEEKDRGFVKWTGLSPRQDTYPVSNEARELLKSTPWFQGILDGLDPDSWAEAFRNDLL